MGRTMRESRTNGSITTKSTRKRTTDETRIPRHENIAQRARELFESSGCPSDRDVEFWLEAERQLREELNA